MKNFIFILLLNVMYSAVGQTLASFDKWIDYPVGSTYLKKAISAETFDGTNTWVAIQIDTSASKKYQQLLRLDVDGNLIFAKEHNTKGFIYNIKATPDDGCLLVGVTAQGSYWVGWVAKCNKFGEIQWSYSYGEPNIHIYLEQAVLAKNGNYVVAGWCYLSGSKYGIVAMEIDTSGTIQWVGKYDEALGSTRVLSRIMVLDDGSYLLGLYYLDIPCYGRMLRLKPDGQLFYHHTYKFWSTLGYCNMPFGISDILPVSHPKKHFYFILGIGSNANYLIETDSIGVVIKTDTIPYGGKMNVLHYNTEKKYVLLTDGIFQTIGFMYVLDSLRSFKVKSFSSFDYYNYSSSFYAKENNSIGVFDNKSKKKMFISKRILSDFNTPFCKDSLMNFSYSPVGYKDTIDFILTSKPTYTRQFLAHSSKNISVTIHTECSKAASIQENLSNSAQQGVFIYPNPAQNHICITLPAHNTDIRIWDMYGKLVYERKNIHTLHQIDIEYFSQGLYNVELQSGNQKQFQKFIKID